eukprot:6488686-Amphidinium_carterae.6
MHIEATGIDGDTVMDNEQWWMRSAQRTTRRGSRGIASNQKGPSANHLFHGEASRLCSSITVGEHMRCRKQSVWNIEYATRNSPDPTTWDRKVC